MTIPNFLICGAPKAGTTALYYALKEHPDIYMSEIKETDFFQHNYEKGFDWYESLFSNYSGQKAIGEASPGNMIHPLAAQRICEHIPKAKLIFILRDPVDRAYSQYWYNIMLGLNSPSMSFSSLIRDHEDVWGQRVVELGMYSEQIKRYRAHFSEDQLLLLLYDDLKAEADSVLKKIYKFLEVEQSFKSEMSSCNSTMYPKNVRFYKAIYGFWKPIESQLKNKLGTSVLDATKGVRSCMRTHLYQKKKSASIAMNCQDREYLSSIYQASNHELSLMLGRDLSHWK